MSGKMAFNAREEETLDAGGILEARTYVLT